MSLIEDYRASLDDDFLAKFEAALVECATDVLAEDTIGQTVNQIALRQAFAASLMIPGAAKKWAFTAALAVMVNRASAEPLNDNNIRNLLKNRWDDLARVTRPDRP